MSERHIQGKPITAVSGMSMVSTALNRKETYEGLSETVRVKVLTEMSLP